MLTFTSHLILITKKTTIWVYHHTIKKKGNQKLYLTDASFLILWSIRHKNSTLKASQYFIDYERQIPVEMVISIQCGWLNVDFTFDTEEIPTSSPCDFFDVVLMSNQLQLLKSLLVVTLTPSFIFFWYFLF